VQNLVSGWAFGGFFFSASPNGLLQICGEYGVLRRERFAGVGAAAYVLAKGGRAAPVASRFVDVLFLVVLRAPRGAVMRT